MKLGVACLVAIGVAFGGLGACERKSPEKVLSDEVEAVGQPPLIQEVHGWWVIVRTEPIAKTDLVRVLLKAYNNTVFQIITGSNHSYAVGQKVRVALVRFKHNRGFLERSVGTILVEKEKEE